eukprot:COSAG01_NODE_2087_length_8456_cov_2.656456_4_plen_123_part_00
MMCSGCRPLGTATSPIANPSDIPAHTRCAHGARRGRLPASAGEQASRPHRLDGPQRDPRRTATAANANANASDFRRAAIDPAVAWVGCAHIHTSRAAAFSSAKDGFGGASEPPRPATTWAHY